MKIYFYCDSIFTFGGVQRVLAGLARELSRRHEVTILTRDDPADEDRSMYGLQDAALKFLLFAFTEIARFTKTFPVRLTVCYIRKFYRRMPGLQGYIPILRSLLLTGSF